MIYGDVPELADFNREHIEEFNYRLIRWFKEFGRSFPWRERNDVYSLLVAEILLQKTNAAKVVDAYNEIIAIYPTPKALSSGSIDLIQKIITPLGLINKAYILVNAARILTSVDENSVTLENLLSIKGIGNYIARSVLIHSREEIYSLLDPNFLRIYERVFGLRSSLSRPRTDKKLWHAAEILLPQEHISQYSYAILDFGALVCTLKKPNCFQCPMYSDVCKGVYISEG